VADSRAEQSLEGEGRSEGLPIIEAAFLARRFGTRDEMLVLGLA
jgi:hypothetical protein